MQYCYDFPLAKVDKLIAFADEYAKPFNTDVVYSLPITDLIPIEIKEEFNNELISYGLPEISKVVIFKRKNISVSLYGDVHIDATDEYVIHSSIVIPVSGYEGTYMYWMTGDYTPEVAYTKSRVSYNKIKWNTPPASMHKVEIVKPTLCRVDIPHAAVSNTEHGYRTIISVRFIENLTVDEILRTRFKQ